MSGKTPGVKVTWEPSVVFACSLSLPGGVPGASGSLVAFSWLTSSTDAVTAMMTSWSALKVSAHKTTTHIISLFPVPQQARKHVHLPHSKHRREDMKASPSSSTLSLASERPLSTTYMLTMLEGDVGYIYRSQWQMEREDLQKNRPQQQQPDRVTQEWASILKPDLWRSCLAIHWWAGVRTGRQNLWDVILLWLPCPHHQDSNPWWWCCCWVTGASHLINPPEDLHHTNHGAKAYQAWSHWCARKEDGAGDSESPKCVLQNSQEATQKHASAKDRNRQVYQWGVP